MMTLIQRYAARSAPNALPGMITALFLFGWLALVPPAAHAQKRVHSVFFEGTDYELHVYRNNGKTPGKTLLLIGGIQGDEPGGFLSADHYADFSLAKGNLIVVPRANFHSIVLKRRKINEDMNRQFSEDRNYNYETKIVAILKQLIAESDCLLNLHDGQGFYSEKWEGPDRNPGRYGQSIIADSETHIDPKTRKPIALGALARSVIKEINQQIKDPKNHFQFNNHHTADTASRHKEQRKSATYYALYTCHIPAFGIETSKSLPLELKVRHHNLAINAFMKRFGIVPETPGLNLEKPMLEYMVVSINDALPVVVKNKQTLQVNAGDTITISHIEANYERGLTADIKGFGTINDIRKKVTITKPAKIVVRKDYYPCGDVYITLDKGTPKKGPGVVISDTSPPPPVIQSFKILINDTEHIAENNTSIQAVRGDTIKIVDVITVSGDPSDLIVNFKGFVGDRRNNTGEDRGYSIDTGKELLSRYSLNKKGKIFQVIVTYEDKTIGKLFIDLKDPV